MTDKANTSRIPGFYDRSIDERISIIEEQAALSREASAYMRKGGGISAGVANRMSENVLCSTGLPLAIGLNFRVNKRDVLIPMAVEEPSVVAAASHAAKLARVTGGFFGEATASVMTTQIQFDGCPDTDAATVRVLEAREQILEVANAAIPGMVRRGFGARDLEVRVLDAEEGLLVVHLYVDVGDAMGANVVDTVAESTAPAIHELVGGEIGLRILSNLPMRRMVKVWAEVSESALGGEALCKAIVRASRFAELDPFRAVTHNKGMMNGIDAVAVALGQDWRSIEAGAHAYAARNGTYGPLATWEMTGRGIRGVLEMPMAVGLVGGSTRAHEGVKAAFELINAGSAPELGIIIGAAGLASNLAALKALAGEGIQRGHMRLHRRKQQEAQREAKAQMGEPST